MDTVGRVRALVEPLVAATSATLYDLEYQGGVLRVTVQREGGVDIDLIARLTREISRELDEVDPIAGEYTLEVSSPGLERPLRRPEHFVGAIGSLVNVKARAGVEGDRRIKGVLAAVDTEAETVDIAPSDAAPGEVRTLAIADIERARTVFEWGPAPKPGTGSKPGSRPTSSPSAKKKAAKP